MLEPERTVERAEADPCLQKILCSNEFAGNGQQNEWRRGIMRILFNLSSDRTALLSAAGLAEKLSLPVDSDNKSNSEVKVRQAVRAIRRELLPAYYGKHSDEAIRFELPRPKTGHSYRLDVYRFRAASTDYTWDQFTQAADDVGERIFKTFQANIVITFPGPSLIFTGLAMVRTLSREEFLRMPVYTLRFVDKQMQPKTYADHFEAVPTSTERFKILVPRAIAANDPKRMNKIAIVDDTILSGITMQALRSYFDGLKPTPYRRKNIKFACFICKPGHFEVPEVAPAFWDTDSRSKITMPWKRDAFCFEDGWPPTPAPRKPGRTSDSAKRGR